MFFIVFHALLFYQEHFKSGVRENMKFGNTTTKDKLIPNPKARLREQVREVMRFHHYSLRTEEAYWQWVSGLFFSTPNDIYAIWEHWRSARF